MTKEFEYKSVKRHQPMSETQLNDYGHMGWELVIIVPVMDKTCLRPTSSYQCIFKRELPKPPKTIFD